MSRSYDHGGTIFATARRMGVPPSALADFSASINPLGPSPLVRSAIDHALDSLIHYPDTGHEELKEALAHYHGLPAAHFVVANGSTELIYQLPAILSGRRALLAVPCFSEYERALERQQWEVHHFPLLPQDGFSLDPARLEAKLAEGYDAFYLCNPGNPSGTLYPPQTIERVRDLCSAAGTFLVLDEAFMDFCEEASAKHAVVAGGNALILRSMTKFFGIPGLRLGYAMANEPLCGRLDALGVPWSVNTLAQAAGRAALRDEEHNRQTLLFIDRERRFLADRLAGLPRLRVYPARANFLLVEITGGMTARELAQMLLPELVIIRDCASFDGLTPRFFRIAVRTRPENEHLVACLEKILTT
ncbi:threonine-phosphate decarboxylase [Geobacter sp. FeAm09]|uniref:threonine-phosphate decarboxylase CobD n=1 Tax=Geobacter sp. FeAm09 TaxID=2597769 RepID=UPI0011F02796|nr:threonine-phosphate decarboxylase CobD [Geobacter sp. FeAm09]QEM69169.1 threonine-phosphate decarboxylase [Geobacter sp. FeAm09]